jgi:hypothetical protein
METLIITKEQALAQGATPGWLRVIANSVERLGREWLRAIRSATEEQKIACKNQANWNFTNARQLRKLASELEREAKK